MFTLFFTTHCQPHVLFTHVYKVALTSRDLDLLKCFKLGSNTENLKRMICFYVDKFYMNYFFIFSLFLKVTSLIP